MWGLETWGGQSGRGRSWQQSSHWAVGRAVGVNKVHPVQVYIPYDLKSFSFTSKSKNGAYFLSIKMAHYDYKHLIVIHG